MKKMRPLFGLSALLLYLYLTYSCTGNADHKTVAVFKPGTTTVQYNAGNDKEAVYKPSSFRVPAFVGGIFNNKEFLTIICGAISFDSSSQQIIDGVAKTSYGTHNQWSVAESFTKDSQKSTTNDLMGDFSAVMKENKIYVLATSLSKTGTSTSFGKSRNGVDLLMFVGTINNSTNSLERGAAITWNKENSLNNALAQAVQEAEAIGAISGVGNGIVTGSGEIVFPIEFYSQRIHRTTSILYSKDKGSTWKIGEVKHSSTFDGSVVEWEDNKLLLIASSSTGYRKAFESEDMGSTWIESVIFSEVWSNHQTRSYYGKKGSTIKVSVDEKKVLLFTQMIRENSASQYETLQLWLSDGQRIVCIGTISDKEKEKDTGNSILVHLGNHLYITHEINPFGIWGSSQEEQEWMQVIGFTPLPQLFESVRSTVRAWQTLDKWLLLNRVPADGLVGFLGNSKDETVWTDMYNCVNATVNNGESVIGGFKFNGKGESGAQWPVTIPEQNQVYAFTRKQFTLAATVKIHNANEKGEFSLIGASFNPEGNFVLIGLGYTHDNKWIAVSSDKKETTTEETIERDKEYHVALTFVNGAAAVFVDGKEIANNTVRVPSEILISHFYMGGMGQSSPAATGSACTVMNVMLFNRALEQKEIEGLFKVSESGKLKEQIPTELTTVVTEESKSVTKTKSTDFSDVAKATSKSKPTSTLDKRISVPKTKSAMIPEDSKSVETTEHNTASVSLREKVTNWKETNKNINESLHAVSETILKKDTKGDNSAAVSLSSVGWMSLVCSVIALTGL